MPWVGQRLTPSGIQFPHTIAPPLGTIRGDPEGTGGQNLSPSSITALRYGIFVAKFSAVISSSLSNLDRTSFVALSRTCLFLAKWKNIPVRAVAVVSAPATASNANVASISPTDMPVSPLFRRTQVMKSGLFWPISRRWCTLALVMLKWSIEPWIDFLGIVHRRIGVKPGKNNKVEVIKAEALNKSNNIVTQGW